MKSVVESYSDERKVEKVLNYPTDEQVDDAAMQILQRIMYSGYSVAEYPDVMEQIAKKAAVHRLSELKGTTRPKKALLVVGPVGCGKTTIIREAFRRCKIVFKTTSDVIYEFQKYQDSFDCDKRNLSHSDIILDDLGAERDGKRFGQTFDVGEWIEWRYRCFKEFGALTYLTTNLASSRAIADSYNERIASRIGEMCDIVLYNGRDRRKNQTPKVLPR